MIYSPESWWLGEVQVYALQDLQGLDAGVVSDQSQSQSASGDVFGYARSSGCKYIKPTGRAPEQNHLPYGLQSDPKDPCHVNGSECHACSNRPNMSQRFHFWENDCQRPLTSPTNHMLCHVARLCGPCGCGWNELMPGPMWQRSQKGPGCRVLHPNHLATVKPANDNDSTFFKLLYNVC